MTEDSDHAWSIVSKYADDVARMGGEIRDLKLENETLRTALADLRVNASLLQQNAEGCAINHYSGDFELQGLPGWLEDTKASIERALAVLALR
jgi:hypothetical protein